MFELHIPIFRWVQKKRQNSKKKKDVNALFVPIFWSHFYFGPYISILPLLVPNPINTCYFSPFRHSTNRKS